MGCEEDAVVAVDCEGPDGNALTAKGLRHLPVASLETDVVLGGGNAADDLVCVVFGLRQAIRHLPRAWAVAVGGHVLVQRLVRAFEIIDRARQASKVRCASA